MTPRERFINALLFKPVDRIPLVEWPIRGATMRAWLKQGYPEGVPTEAFFVLDPSHLPVPVNMTLYPAFEEVTLEETHEYRIWQDNLGTTRKDFKIIENEGFVTRSWLSFPVTDKASFQEIKKRYISSDTGRIPEYFDECCRVLNNANVSNHLSIPFLFWTVRDWVGFENLCIMFYEDPGLVHEMFEFLTDFCIEVLSDKIHKINIDIVEFKEDMAYKHAPMISPKMFKEFMYPHYVRLIHFLKSNGVKIVYVDCDGYPGGLIPIWIEAGVDAMSPVEIAAGNDVLELRKEYPAFGMMGGIDKRELSKTRERIYNEVIGKIPFLIEKGGFIPHVDHAIPFDIPLDNYLYFRDLMSAVVTGQSIPNP